MGSQCSISEKCATYKDAYHKSKIVLEGKSLMERGQRVKTNAHAVSKDYELSKGRVTIVHQGSKAVMSKAMHKKSKTWRALKEPSTSWTGPFGAWWQRDLMVMQSCDHPNICRLFEHYTGNAPCQIMELCIGKSLTAFCRTEREKLKEEALSGLVMRQALSAVGHLHSHGYCHLELSPDDFFFTKIFPNGPALNEVHVKLTSLGAVERIQKNLPAKMESIASGFPPGSAHHSKGLAPEQALGQKANVVVKSDLCDIWAIGVIAFSMLNNGAFPVVRQSGPQTDWIGVPSRARGFISSCLTLDPAKRPRATDLLEVNPWLLAAQKEYIAALDEAHKSLGQADILKAGAITPAQIVDGFRTMSAMSKFERAVVTGAVHLLPPERTEQMRRVFQRLDTNGNGSLCLPELVSGLGDVVGGLGSTEDMAWILERIDTDGSRSIDYTEFVAALFSCKRDLRDEVCKAAFAIFDEDDSGKVTLQEMKAALGLDLDATDDDNITGSMTGMDLADVDGDGAISFKEFKQLLTGKKDESIRVSKRVSTKSNKSAEERGKSRSPKGGRPSLKGDDKALVETKEEANQRSPGQVQWSSGASGPGKIGMMANPVQWASDASGLGRVQWASGASGLGAMSGAMAASAAWTVGQARQTASATTARVRRALSKGSRSKPPKVKDEGLLQHQDYSTKATTTFLQQNNTPPSWMNVSEEARDEVHRELFEIREKRRSELKAEAEAMIVRPTSVAEDEEEEQKSEPSEKLKGKKSKPVDQRRSRSSSMRKKAAGAIAVMRSSVSFKVE